MFPPELLNESNPPFNPPTHCFCFESDHPSTAGLATGCYALKAPPATRMSAHKHPKTHPSTAGGDTGPVFAFERGKCNVIQINAGDTAG